MSSRSQAITKIESVLLILLSVSMLPSLIIAVLNNERQSLDAFLAVIISTALFGMLMLMYARKSNYKYRYKNRDGFFIVTLSWLVAITVGALPYWLSGEIPSFIDAFFESCSGFTTTGATILTDVEGLPVSLLFWRSFTNWLGGAAVVMLITAIIPAFVMEGEAISPAENAGLTKIEILYDFAKGSKGIYKIFLGLAAAEVILLMFAGLDILDALMHTFGTVSTGGFSAYNDGISHFNSDFVEAITLIFMFFAAFNYNLYFLAKKRGIKAVFNDEETKFYCTLVAVIGLILALYNVVFNNFKDIGKTIFDSFFQVVSIVSTTGYTSTDYNAWATFAKFVLLALFLVGGCQSSASGGIKCVRILGSFKLIIRGIYLKIHPNIISPVTLDHKEMSNETAIKLTYFVFTYFVLIAAGTLCLSFGETDFITNFSAAMSCLGNIGPGFNMLGSGLNYSIFHDISKLFCSFLMLTGRLELYCVLVLFSRNYWNPNRTR